MAAKRYKLQGWNGKKRGWLSFGVDVEHVTIGKMLCAAIADQYEDPHNEYRCVPVSHPEGETIEPAKPEGRKKT